MLQAVHELTAKARGDKQVIRVRVSVGIRVGVITAGAAAALARNLLPLDNPPAAYHPPIAHQVGAKGSKLLGKRFDLDEDGDVSVADQLRDALVSNAVRNLLGPTDYGLFI